VNAIDRRNAKEEKEGKSVPYSLIVGWLVINHSFAAAKDRIGVFLVRA
jgi:hypothetical protein